MVNTRSGRPAAPSRHVRLTLPVTGEEELEEVRKVLESGYLTQGPKVAEFERDVLAMIGGEYGFAMTSATTALHLSLVALGIGPGDDVLVPDYTFPASANVVVQQGARPVLVDVRPDTYAVDIQDLESRITPNTRAIMPVHPFGLSADMEGVMAVARRHNLAVVEDAACALAARIGDRFCGTIGDLGCFSFHPRKSITTGEGGMIVTADPALAERIRLLRSHGGVRDGLYFRFEEAGFNYRLSDVQAAIGIAQLRKLPWVLSRRRELAARLTGMLQPLPAVTPPIEPVGYVHTYQSYVVMLDPAIDRDSVIVAMRERGVETTLGTYALHAQPFFQRSYGYAEGDLPGSHAAFRHSLTLPLYPTMTEDDLVQVVTALEDSLDVAGA